MNDTTDSGAALLAFLDGLGLAQYHAAMVAEDLTLESLADLEEADLKELGLSIGHRKALRRALAERPASAQNAPAAPSPSAEPKDQRRQVTIFFCDLVGSTVLASTHDAEDMADILGRYHKLTEEIMTNFGGVGISLQGDGVVACFGYPKAHEDDAARAVAAALEISRRVPQLKFPNGLVLGSRIGVATGRVFVRGQSDISSALVGDTLNLAARLQDCAQTDRVVISTTTRRLIERVADLEPLGEHALKGFDAPVGVWQVNGLHDIADLQAEQSARLIGREAEANRIAKVWETAKSGQGQAIVLTGGAGIGKSALLDGARAMAKEDGATVVRYYCASGYENSALYPIQSEIARSSGLRDLTGEVDVAGQLAAWSGSDDPAAIRMLADLLSLDPGADYPALDMTGTEQRWASYQLLLAQLGAQAANGPMLVLLEDAHWADPTTLEFLKVFVSQALAALPILLIVSTRPSGTVDIGDEAHVHQHSVERLGKTESRSIVERVFGAQVCPPDVMHRIIDASDGIPLYLEELSRSALEQQQAGGEGLKAVTVPVTLEDSLMARLDRLSHGKDVVQTAAVFGRRFPVEPLRQTLALSDASFDTALSEPVAARILVHPGPSAQDDSMLFRHALVQQAAYEGLARRQRQDLHDQIAAHLLEHQPGLAETEPETLARHFAGGGKYTEAINYLLLAGKKATARAAQVEATNHYFAALEHLQHLPEGRARDEQEVLLRALLGGALMATRGFAAPEVHDSFARARALCIQLGDSPMYCSCLYGLFTVEASRSNKEEAMALAAEMLATFGQVPVPSWQIATQFANGVAQFFAGDFDKAETHFDQAVSLYTPDQHDMLVEQFGDNLTEFSMCYRQWIHLLRGQIDASAALLAKAEDMANALKNKNAQTRSIAFRMGRMMELEALEEVAELAPKVVEISTTQGYPYWACAGQIGLGWTMASNGAEDGLLPITGSLDFFDMIGQRLPQTYWRMSMIAAHTALGQRDAALAAADKALDMSHAGLDSAFEAGILWRRGQAQMCAPADLAAAEQTFRDGLAVAQKQGVHLHAFYNALGLAEVLLSQSRGSEEGGVLATALERVESSEDFPALTRAKTVLKDL